MVKGECLLGSGRARYGVDKVYIATMHGQRDAAPRRIPFGKPPDLRLADLDE